ncbi:MAG: SRPBCC family protein [Gammaproteobacteria bacterium]|jgi:uncharacterized protein YndB with AHSA1/START domain|nr:SRPBCC family protein [Gammaproteobacteria bacterium]MDG2337615.1 SRPBCC family protein [Gammaproteobacteria bacterium]
MEDRIEKTVDLKAPIERVWQALSDHREFGEWFQVALERSFLVGEKTEGNITYPGYEHMRLEALIKTMDINKLLACTWCPVSDDEGYAPLGDIETLVEFKLESIHGGTRLKIIESGFTAIPDEKRRLAALETNSGGWEMQTENIKTHVET